MHADPETWAGLMAWAADVTGAFLRAQVAAGARRCSCSTRGPGRCRPRTTGRTSRPGHAGPCRRRRARWCTSPRRAASCSPSCATWARHGVGVDHRVPLDEAGAATRRRHPVQGNIDPALLAAPWPVLAEHVRDVLRRGDAPRATWSTSGTAFRRAPTRGC